MKRYMTIFVLTLTVGVICFSAEQEANKTDEIKSLTIKAMKAGLGSQQVGRVMMDNSINLNNGNFHNTDQEKLKEYELLFNQNVGNLREVIMSSPESFNQAIEIIRENKNKDIGNFLQIWGTSGVDANKFEILSKSLLLLEDTDPYMQKTAIYSLTPTRTKQFNSSGYGIIPGIVSAKVDEKFLFPDYAIKNEKAQTALRNLLVTTEEKDIKKDVIWALTYSQAYNNIIDMFLDALKKEGDVDVKQELIRAISQGGFQKNSATSLIDLLTETNENNIKREIIINIATPYWQYLPKATQKKLYNVLLDTIKNNQDEKLRTSALNGLYMLYTELPTLPSDLQDILRNEKSNEMKEGISKLLIFLKTYQKESNVL